MSLSTLPLEVGELIFSEVVWDGFCPELIENLNSASDCIDRVHERNRQLRALRPTARLVDCIVNRLAHKYVHITSQTRADELINTADDLRLQGAAVRHLFLDAITLIMRHTISGTLLNGQSRGSRLEHSTICSK